MLVGCVLAADAASGSASGAALRAMTFNIRLSSMDDGINSWDKRRERCLARIVEAAPDLLGLQEARPDQANFLRERLADHTLLSVRNNAIFYRTARFTAITAGTFWLSETPEVPDSMGWDAARPRLVSWIRLQDRAQGGRELLWINTHFDHKGTRARSEEARILRRFIAGQGPGVAVILAGDFNAAAGSEPHRILLDPGTDGVALADTYAVAHRDAVEPNAGTYQGFRENPPRNRIDWILVSPVFTVRAAEIDRYHEGPLFPSDHFPVIATLAWSGSP